MIGGESTTVRILMLSNLYPPDVEGGAEILAGDIADGLARQGHDVHVLTSSPDPSVLASHPRVRRTLRLAGPVRVDPGRPLWRQIHLPYRYYLRFHQPTNAHELRRVVAEVRPDVLYIWEITGLGVTSLLSTLPTLRLPIVFQLGSYWLLYARSPETAQSRFHAQWLKRWLIGTVPRLAWTSLIAVSGAVKEEYVRAGFDADRIEVIHNGISPRFLQTPPRRGATNPNGHSQPMRLLYVGRLCPEKGVAGAIRALGSLIAGDEATPDGAEFSLDIVGDGDPAYIRMLQAYVRENRLAERVTFHGRVPQDTLIEYYNRADVLLNPSLWREPFGLTTVEAMARGLPVIASRTGGTAEIITPGINGVLTAPGDEHALASAIRQLAENPAQRARMADAARRMVEEHFTIEENARRIAHHLQRTLPGNRVVRALDAREAPEGARRTV